MLEFKKDLLTVKIAESAEEMGEAAAEDICEAIRSCLGEKDEINMIFAAAPSQNTMLAALLKKEIEWNRINAFHMDEYIGLKRGSNAAFQNYLKEHIFDLAPFKSIHYINAWEEDRERECVRYSELLEKCPVDIVCLGIGENGHIAFNDPPKADFQDPVLIKTVELEERCRMQQVHDGCFESIDDVPQYALTLTVPALTVAKKMFCVVPYASKAEAVKELLTSEVIDEHCPALIMRKHAGATLYCDKDSAKEYLK